MWAYWSKQANCHIRSLVSLMKPLSTKRRFYQNSISDPIPPDSSDFNSTVKRPIPISIPIFPSMIFGSYLDIKVWL